MIGLIYNNLKIIEDLGIINKRHIVKVECICGNKKEIRLDILKRGAIKSCGCMQHQLKHIFDIGETSGRLTITEDMGMINGIRSIKCKCSCNNSDDIVISYNNFKNGNIRSCGCLAREIHKLSAKQMSIKNIKHGESKNSNIYNVWINIKARCYNTKHEKYKWYGGRGIFVCNEWINDYMAFKMWSLDNGYKKGLSIDRIDVTKSYNPDNCQWITRQENIEKEYTIDRENWRKYKYV